ncbi:MAG: hypothetical protein ACREPL_11940 [Rhodanobacteraceae bacterium]
MLAGLKRKIEVMLKGDAPVTGAPGSDPGDPSGEPAADARERARVIDLLQSYRASESLNARYCGMWAQVTVNERMRGGLRTVQAREGTHARLMRERLKELGETQFVQVPQAQQARAVAFFASSSRSDLKKLSVLKSMMDDFDAYFRSLVDDIESIRGDSCTQELLRTIIDDERATTLWFARMYSGLSARHPQA